MFLSRKAMRRVWSIAAIYFVLGAVLLALSWLSAMLEIAYMFALVFGIVCIVVGVLCCFVGRYIEGTSKLIRIGNQLVYQQLRPAKFIERYEEARNAPDNIVAKPDFDVLRLAAVAYMALGDEQHVQEMLEEMYAAAPARKKQLALLFQASVLYGAGNIQEAESILDRVQHEKMGLLARSTFDMILKSDRAMALGEYGKAEVYYKQMLQQTFPQYPPLVLLSVHISLARIYYLTGRREEMEPHCNYCIQNGGETKYPSDAAKLLQRFPDAE